MLRKTGSTERVSGMNVRTTMTIVLLGATVALTACGRKGDLDTPYQAAVEARKEAERNNEPLPPAPRAGQRAQVLPRPADLSFRTPPVHRVQCPRLVLPQRKTADVFTESFNLS